jgi:uncharacterized protein YdhG (YjbR/CyaY superfamily)
MAAKTRFKTVDEYIESFPKDIQEKLELIREIIRENVPGAKEVISYQIPAFKLNGIVVWYAGFKNHIGFYPTAKPIEVFKKELKDYYTSKGTIKFPLNKKIPEGLISKITKFRVKEDLKSNR